MVRRAIARERVHMPLERARNDLLKTVAKLAPDVLRELADVPAPGGPTLGEWAAKWNLDAPWVLAVARNTLELWRFWPAGRGRQWDANHAETGELVPERGRLPKRPAELLIRSAHLEWWVRARVLHQKYETIACLANVAELDSIGRAVRAFEKKIVRNVP